MDELKWEVDAEKIYKGYKRDELFKEFLEWYSGEINAQSPVCVSVKQRDYEAVGGLLCEAFELYLSECADYDARRIQEWG